MVERVERWRVERWNGGTSDPVVLSGAPATLLRADPVNSGSCPYPIVDTGEPLKLAHRRRPDATKNRRANSIGRPSSEICDFALGLSAQQTWLYRC